MPGRLTHQVRRYQPGALLTLRAYPEAAGDRCVVGAPGVEGAATGWQPLGLGGDLYSSIRWGVVRLIALSLVMHFSLTTVRP